VTATDDSLRFLLLTGNPGSGKSTLAASLSRELQGWIRVDADRLAMDYEVKLRTQGRTGRIHWAEIRREGYGQALERIDDGVQKGRKILVDATLNTRAECDRFATAARVKGHPAFWRLVQLRCSAASHYQRRIADPTLPGEWAEPRSPGRARKIAEVFNDPLCRFSTDLHPDLLVETDGIEPGAVLALVRSGLGLP
jgi:predicted kinase